MNVLSFRRSPWYSSGVLILIVVILISIYIIALGSVSFLTSISFSSSMRLLVGYNDYRGGDNRDGPIFGNTRTAGMARVGTLLIVGPNTCSFTD